MPRENSALAALSEAGAGKRGLRDPETSTPSTLSGPWAGLERAAAYRFLPAPVYSLRMSWSLYLVRRADGSLYTGIALDVERRFAEHAAGQRGAKALRGRGPLELVYQAEIGDRAVAQGLEHRVKRLAKSEKEQIVLSGPTGATLLARFGLK